MVSLKTGIEDNVTYFLLILRSFSVLLQFNLKLFQRSMAKKQDSPCKNENSSGAAKFGNTLSFVSVLICSAVLVRVEIVNQRVDTVENSLVEIRLQNPDTNFHGSGKSFKQEKRERYINGLNLNDQDVRDLEAGKWRT